MNALKLAVGMLGMLMANVALAAPPCTAGPNCVGLPMDDVGLVAVAAILLVTGIKIIRQKRSR